MAKRSPPGAPARKRAAKRGKAAAVKIKRQIGACSSPPRLVVVAAIAAVAAAAASSSGSNSYSASSPIDAELHRSTAESLRFPRPLAVSNAPPGDDRSLPSRCCLSNCSGEEEDSLSSTAAFRPPASVHDPATPSAEDADDLQPAPAEASPPADDLKPASCTIRRRLLPKMPTISNLLRGCRLLLKMLMN